MNKKLLDWSEETVEYLHEVVTDKDNKELDLSFYAFQSEPKINPNVVFLGINPGGESYSYDSLFKNPIWNLSNVGRMTPERFLQPNPFINEINDWKIWKELQKSFGSYPFFNDYVYMNLIYFNTPNVEDLKNRKNGSIVYNKNVEFTKKLLTEIIRPKCIICLGTKDCFDRLTKQDKVLLQSNKRLVSFGYLDGIKVFGIPHPSGSYTSNDHKKEIGKIIMENIKI